MDLVSAITFAGAALVTILVTPLTIVLARRFGLFDRPDARRVHKTPTPRLGGIGIMSGILIAGLLSIVIRNIATPSTAPKINLQLLAIGGASLFVFLVGLLDDLRTVSSRYKLLTLIAASLVVCGAGVTFDDLLFGGKSVLAFQWLNWSVTTLWIIGITVAISFHDGLDGLAASVTFLGSSILAIVLTMNGDLLEATIPIVLSGALLGFLVFNWHPAKTFMGDCGSLTIGFMLGCSTVLANSSIGTMRGVVLPTLALCVPISDAALTLFRRHYQQRRSIFSAEEGHLHHSLLKRGMSHPQVVFTILAVSIIAIAIGLLSLQYEGWGTLGGLSLLIPLMWGTFRLGGSIRTSEMIDALKRKHISDRTSLHYRESFEALQLEFNHVSTFAEWWQVICRTADKLDFIVVRIPVTARDGSTRLLEWTCADDRWQGCTRLSATVPIADRRRNSEPLQASIEIAAATTLESAGERLALFSRLMSEYNLASIERQVSVAKSRNSKQTASRKQPMVGTDCGPFRNLRVAVVHDFFYTYAGAERVVEQFINIFPHCDVFALFDFLPEAERHFLQGKTVKTSMLQFMPLMKSKHRAYLPLVPFSIEQLDLRDYDLIVSSSYLAAKGVITGPDQLHVCYCHTPARYAWDLQHQYLDQAKLGFGPRGLFARFILHYIRNWDARSAAGVDYFIANSKFVARRIGKLYRREAAVIYPPVDTEFFVPSGDERGDYYITLSRMVSYKRTDLIVQAFSRMPHRKLKVIGTGPDYEFVRRNAGPNVEFLGYQDAEVVRYDVQRAKALVFAAEEDFGIVPVEALACGTPVIAYGKGGVTESVVAGKHGIFFSEQSPESLMAAVEEFELHEFSDEAISVDIRRHAERFSKERFKKRITEKIGQWVVQYWPERALSDSRPSTSNGHSATIGGIAGDYKAQSSAVAHPLTNGIAEHASN